MAFANELCSGPFLITLLSKLAILVVDRDGPEYILPSDSCAPAPLCSPGDSPEAERVEVYLARGSSEEKLLSLMESLRRVAGVREISSSLDEVRRIR